MTYRQKKILFFIMCAFLLQVYVAFNIDLIQYWSDHLLGFSLSVTRKISPRKDSFTISGGLYGKKYTQTYSQLPRGFLHCGHTLLFHAYRDTTVKSLAEIALRYTHYFKRYQLIKAIKKFNSLENSKILRDTIVYIPHSIPPLILDLKKEVKPRPIYSRGLYYTGSTAGSRGFFRLIDKYSRMGINTVVFDAKDITGLVTYRSHTPLVQELDTHGRRSIDNIDRFIRLLKQREIFTVARIAVFHDHLLYNKRPGLAIQSARNGKPWKANGEYWCDPTSRTVQDYNLALAIELAEKGVDEIQFDYIRFPTSGDLSDARYAYDFGRMSRQMTITHFLKRAHAELSKRKTLLSIDIFGVVAWSKQIDIRRTGQNIQRLTRYCDIISPMLYPSHFNDDFDGYKNPGDNPYYFINEGCKKVRSLAGSTVIRPWLQAFGWRTSSYNADYILRQIKGAHDAGARGYLFWNAANDYETVYKALARLNIRHRENDKDIKNREHRKQAGLR